MSQRFSARRLCAGMILALVAGLAMAAPAAFAKPLDVVPAPTPPTVAAKAHGPHLAASALGSTPAGATAGDRYVLHGTVSNTGTAAASGPVTVRLIRHGQKPTTVGRVSVSAPARTTRAYRVAVTVPSSLANGSYTLMACAHRAGERGALGCAAASRSLDVGQPQSARGAKASVAIPRHDDPTCSSGAHTLSEPGDTVYPEMGNGGYVSAITRVNLVYDAVRDEFLAGNNVELTDVATECLTDFSVDFARHTIDNIEPGTSPANMQIQSVTVEVNEDENPEDAAFTFVQPTYPGDPNGQNDPDPLAHRSGNETPVSATNPNPPACAPEPLTLEEAEEEEANDQPCPANKLVITPAVQLQAGDVFNVTINYTGRPGAYTDGDGLPEGWFRSNSPVGDGSFVTTEPVGTMAWMPLNNHPSAKPTYQFKEKVTAGRTVVSNGLLISTTDNLGDVQFPAGSTTWRWRSREPIANYLVENSIGAFDLSERFGDDGVVYYQAQGSSISARQKALNKAALDQQENITRFQERFNGIYPFQSNGVVVGIPPASFQEEMQGKITFNGGTALSSGNTLRALVHENMHQWWGDNVSESNFNETFFKEGLARFSEYLQNAEHDAIAAGGLDTPHGDAAFEASLAAQFHVNYNRSGSIWTGAPSNPTPVTLFGVTARTYDRPATAYIALRQILGKDNFANALKRIQLEFRGGSIEESQLEDRFQQWLPNQSQACHARLGTFFNEWFDAEYPKQGEPTEVKPELTGPGLDPSASGTTFYNADGSCEPPAVPKPPTTPPPPPPAKPACAQPQLTVTVSHPLSRGAGTVTLLKGKAYHFIGRLTCGGTAAPEGTPVSVSSVVAGHTSPPRGLAVGGNGKIDALMRFSSKRVVVFSYSADGASAKASVRVAIAKLKPRIEFAHH